MVVCSELCIDKGRHRSAFHNSVNNVHINRKKQKQVVKDQKRENVLPHKPLATVSFVSVFCLCVCLGDLNIDILQLNINGFIEFHCKT